MDGGPLSDSLDSVRRLLALLFPLTSMRFPVGHADEREGFLSSAYKNGPRSLHIIRNLLLNFSSFLPDSHLHPSTAVDERHDPLYPTKALLYYYGLWLFQVLLRRISKPILLSGQISN